MKKLMRERSRNKIASSKNIDNEDNEASEEITSLRESHRRIDRKMLEKISSHKKERNESDDSAEPFESKYPENTPVKTKKPTNIL